MDVESLMKQAQDASNATSTAIQGLPKALSDLRSNLNTIYNKDNPLISDRANLLENYLKAGDVQRANNLPQNAGVVYSPTQLQALVSGAKAAALAPLTSLNQLIVGQYGTIPDLVNSGRDIANAYVQSLSSKATDLFNLAQLAEKKREYDLSLAQSSSGLGGLGGLNFGGGYGGGGTGGGGITPPNFVPTKSGNVVPLNQAFGNTVPLNQAFGNNVSLNQAFGSPYDAYNLNSQGSIYDIPGKVISGIKNFFTSAPATTLVPNNFNPNSTSGSGTIIPLTGLGNIKL